jgi:hypothetical protein
MKDVPPVDADGARVKASVLAVNDAWSAAGKPVFPIRVPGNGKGKAVSSKSALRRPTTAGSEISGFWATIAV